MKPRIPAIFCSLIFLSTLALAAENPDFTVKRLGEGVYAAVSADGSKAGSNAGFIVGSNAVLVVDTFEDAGPAKELLAEIRKVTNLPIRFVVNTHYHLDHTGGNAVFAHEGAIILAQRNVRTWLHTENMKFFGPAPKPEAKARVEALVAPDIGYQEALDVFLGKRVVQVRYMPGHTGGDSVVIVPDANVVFGGDLVWQKHLPNLIDANTLGWLKSVNTLLLQHATATFVSGHGGIATPQDVRDFRDYLLFLRTAVSKSEREGKRGQAVVDEVLPQLKEKYGNWGFFNAFASHNIQQTADELRGIKHVPMPGPAQP